MNSALESQMPSIVILDLNLPGEDGISISKRLRSALPHVGVVMLTARVRSIDRNEGYAAGADVYLTKPTSPDEIVQVIKNLYRRLTPLEVSDDWELDTEKNLLEIGHGEELALTSLETLLIKELILHGKFISHDDLMYYLGDQQESSDFNKSRIEVLISRIRKKVSAVTPANTFIKVIRGRGYQLLKPISLKNDNWNKKSYSLVKTKNELKQIFLKICDPKTEFFALDTETTGLDIIEDIPIGVSLCFE